MKSQIPFIGQAYAFANPSVAVQETINYYLEVSQTEQREPLALRGAPGLSAFNPTALPGACRSVGRFDVVLSQGGTLWGVFGTSFGLIGSDGVFASKGTITGTSRLFIREDINYIVIADRPFDMLDGYFIFPGTTNVIYTFRKGLETFTQVSGPAFDSLTATGKENTYFISNINDPNTYNALNFVAVTARFNVVVAIAVMNRNVIVFGTEYIDYWYLSGDAIFPFSRQQGTACELGCFSYSTIALCNDKIVFLATNKQVYMITTYNPEPISTPPINEDLNNRLEFANAIGFFFNWKGHQFYCLRTDTSEANAKTWIYDLTLTPTLGWSRRVSSGLTFWRGNYAAESYGKVFVGDYNGTNLWVLSDSVYTEGADALEATRTGYFVHNQGKTFKIDDVEVVCQEGAASLDADPGIFLSYSKDGGKTFSTERERKFSDTRLLWRNNGVSHGTIAFKVRTSARRNRDIVSFTAKLIPGNDR